MRSIPGYLSALCILVLIVCEAFIIPTFFTPFYSYEYDKREIPAGIRVEKPELMRVTDEMLDYMRGSREDLNVPAVVNGENREFFNQREKDHMTDVRVLFDRLFMARNIAFWALLLLILFMILLKQDVLFTVSRCAREVVIGFLLLCAVLAGIIAFDFDAAFNMFHVLFFDNDLWILNPATDLLVNIVPQGFFIDIAAFVGIMFLLVSAVIILLASVLVRRGEAKPTGRPAYKPRFSRR